jgi:ATP-dependent Clp protease adapter protein ClpS
MGVLGYTEPRAEQLALMAHTNGKTALKEGEMSVLEELHDSFGILNVTTEIN